VEGTLDGEAETPADLAVLCGFRIVIELDEEVLGVEDRRLALGLAKDPSGEAHLRFLLQDLACAIAQIRPSPRAPGFENLYPGLGESQFRLEVAEHVPSLCRDRYPGVGRVFDYPSTAVGTNGDTVLAHEEGIPLPCLTTVREAVHPTPPLDPSRPRLLEKRLCAGAFRIWGSPLSCSDYKILGSGLGDDVLEGAC